MSSEVEQAGAAITAGLAAAELDRSALPAAGEPAGRCANCGTVLTGRFCHACGQSAHLHRSLLHLLEELGHNLLHFDAKGWRTLPLLILRPGVLTRRYIDGQRTRYVSPLALFLFMSFLMFFVVSLLFSHARVVTMTPGQQAAAHEDLAAEVESDKKQVAQGEAAVAAARGNGTDAAGAAERLASAQQEQRVAEAALRLVDAGAAAANASVSAGGTGWQGLSKALAARVDTGHPAIDAAIRRQLENPELFFYRLGNTAYKCLFMLIPISLPFLWLMFAGRRGVAVYDHAVFSLYSLSFMSMLIVVCALLGNAGQASLAALLMLAVPPLHMFLQLRGTYGLGTFSALWRTVVLLGVAGTAFTVFLGFIVIVSLR